MQDNDKSDAGLKELKKRAEQIVRDRPERRTEEQGADLVRLIHKLEVYQVEVELQNQELQKAVKDLETTRYQWFELFDAAPVGFVLIDAHGNIEHCNRAAARLLSGVNRSMAGRSLLSRIHPEDREIYFSLHRSLAAAGGISSRDIRFMQDNRKIVHAHVEAALVTDAEGMFSQWRLALVDISERKAYETALENARSELRERVRERTAELEKRNSQLARLTSELTLSEQQERKRLAEFLHDHLQQLLAGARLHLEILVGEAGIQEKSSYRSAYDLVTEAIEASRSLSSELSSPVLYQKGLPEAFQWLGRWMLRTHQLDIDLDLPEHFPPLPVELRVLLFHSTRELLFNVVKHAETLKARVVVRYISECVRITVSDDGRGCDPVGLEAVGHGSGFGLFAIRERLESIGGGLEMHCSPGEGTSITIIAPGKPSVYTFSEEPEPARQETCRQPADTPAQTNSKIRVMLVDDHAVMRQGLASILSAQPDIEIAGEAGNGEEAVEAARKIQPDIILMDISMPKMNGVEATRRIRWEMPNIRVYGLSMFDAEDQGGEMAEAGASGYLNKSGSTESLLSAIREINQAAPRRDAPNDMP